MFLNKLLRNFAFRLSLWYALVFALCTAILLVLLYYLVGSAFQRKDQEVILARLKEYATVYQAGGAGALEARARQENPPADDKSYYVQLISPHVSLAGFQWDPNGWGGLQPAFKKVWNQFEINRIPKTAEKDFTLAGAKMADGAVLLVGRITNNRETIWQPLRQTALPAGARMENSPSQEKLRSLG